MTRGLRSLQGADACRVRSEGDQATANWAEENALGMRAAFEAAWWFGQEGATQYADSLRNPDNQKVFQRHWIGVTQKL